MAQNRYLPYGYKVENGKITTQLQEAEIIRRIYSRYAEGLSYKKIAEQLTESGVRYMPDKPQWNKNMVARILQNQSYLGTEKYPAIIENNLSHAAHQMVKPYTHTESADIKLLKPLFTCGICGAQVKRRLKTSGEERWFCPNDGRHIAVAMTDETLLAGIEKLQNHLVANRYLAKARQDTQDQIDLGVVRMQNQIDLALNEPTPNLAEIQQIITALASQKYALIQDPRYNEKELQEKIAQLATSSLDSRLLKEITAQIKLAHTAATALILKNGQTLPLPTAEKGVPNYE
ncbi:recombinase family protein [Pygmaiobacter massiliensis]|uniref:recombinase family protein n=1 Tax=Pygmaiobacter massiliensis TaxID=1917873 RepID=UPI002896E2B7|nr:recombinase family protein [Pygmaiobacter massiliensis]